MMIVQYAVSSLALNYPCKGYQIIVHSYCVHTSETNTHARVNLYEMSSYKSC